MQKNAGRHISLSPNCINATCSSTGNHIINKGSGLKEHYLMYLTALQPQDVSTVCVLDITVIVEHCSGLSLTCITHVTSGLSRNDPLLLFASRHNYIVFLY